jgi:hypothetical protein
VFGEEHKNGKRKPVEYVLFIFEAVSHIHEGCVNSNECRATASFFPIFSQVKSVVNMGSSDFPEKKEIGGGVDGTW